MPFTFDRPDIVGIDRLESTFSEEIQIESLKLEFMVWKLSGGKAFEALPNLIEASLNTRLLRL